MTRQVLLNALGRQFGVGWNVSFPSFHDQALSSREIRGIIAKAGSSAPTTRKQSGDEPDAPLSVFAGRSDMRNPAFRDRRAVNEVAGRCCKRARGQNVPLVRFGPDAAL